MLTSISKCAAGVFYTLSFSFCQVQITPLVVSTANAHLEPVWVQMIHTDPAKPHLVLEVL